MNKSKIEWCDYTWNPYTGCLHGCEYCYARGIANRFKGKAFPKGFKPTYKVGKLVEPSKLKTPSRIFVSSMGDVFGDWVHSIFITKLLDVCKWNPQHTFIFLTKNPKRYQKFYFTKNCWLGISASTEEDFNQRVKDWDQVDGRGAGGKRFVSLEPLQGKISIGNIFHWVIVGQETGFRKERINVETKWVDEIISSASLFQIPLFLKDNLSWHKEIKEYPKER